jgi:hypothetical protein
MPTTPRYPRFANLQYEPQPYQSRHSNTIGEILARRGQSAAALELAQGDAAARMWTGVGDAITGSIRQWQELQDRDRYLQMQEDDRRALANLRGVQTKAAESEMQQAAEQQRREQEFRMLLRSGKGREAVLKQIEGDPDLFKRATDHFNAIDQEHNRFLGGIAARIREFGDDPMAASAVISDLMAKGYDRREMGSLLTAIEKDPTAVTRVVDSYLQRSPDDAHRALVKKSETVALGPNQRLVDKTTGAEIVPAVPETPSTPNPTEASLAYQAALGDKAAADALRRLRAQRPEPQGPQSPIAVIGPDGNPVYVRPSEALGRPPASTREQGRQVTSGDAGEIADFKNSLDELAAVRSTLEGNKATGAAAQVGAALPNVVTEVTGWGADAKQKQAVIDRVKQVIGKALEGGVLRKEDERKYTKILPTIGDPPEVVAAKLDGLKDALEKRIGNKLDSLSDAGYDVSRFTQRDGGTVQMIAPDGRPLNVPAAQVDEAIRRGAKRAGG